METFLSLPQPYTNDPHQHKHLHVILSYHFHRHLSIAKATHHTLLSFPIINVIKTATQTTRCSFHSFPTVPDPLTTRATHQKPVPVPSPKLPVTNISISQSSSSPKSPNGAESTCPDLANPNHLTPLPPFLTPRLKPQPEPPDATPSPSSTSCAPSKPPKPPETKPPDNWEKTVTRPPPPQPEPPDRGSLSLLLFPSEPPNQNLSTISSLDLAKTLSDCESKLPPIAVPVNDEVFTEKSHRGGSTATLSPSHSFSVDLSTIHTCNDASVRQMTSVLAGVGIFDGRCCRESTL